jgi:hypothetical protein
MTEHFISVENPHCGNTFIKIYPQLIITAYKHGYGGPIRIYSVARNMDKNGAGFIRKSTLIQHLEDCVIKPKSIQRWLERAIELRFFRQTINEKFNEEIVYYCSPDKVSIIIGAKRLGNPVIVNEINFLGIGWHKYVWLAYLATKEGGLYSKKRKATETGIHPRTQETYEVELNINKIRNDVEIGKGGEKEAEELRNGTGGYYYSKNGRLLQRLPDIITLPNNNDAMVWKGGRVRKYQNRINLSFKSEREQGMKLRLFYNSEKRAYEAIKKGISKGHLTTGDIVTYYVLLKNESNQNRWKLCQYLVP